VASQRETDDRMSIRHEINVALFWRRVIGDDEYIKFDPADMLRWHDAMDLRDPFEIKELMDERFITVGKRTPIVGIVDTSPHPPAWLVRAWQEEQVPKFRKSVLVNGYTAWLICSLITGSFVYGCQHLQPYNLLVWHAPFTQPPLTAQSPMAPLFGQAPAQQPPQTFSVPVQPPRAARSTTASGGGGAPPAAPPPGSSSNAPP
jgi:hypothetical protein